MPPERDRSTPFLGQTEADQEALLEEVRQVGGADLAERVRRALEPQYNLADILRGLEWEGPDEYVDGGEGLREPSCPRCKKARGSGHLERCDLGRALAGWDRFRGW